MSWIAAALMVGAMSAQESSPLPAPVSPGQAIQDAARASAHEGPQEPPKNVEILYGGQAKSGAVEILSDTKGVDFGPYLRNIMADLRSSWYKRIPADAQTRKGKVAIQFAILPDGRIAALKLVETSGDVSLDCPA
jgi:outer membrane biosynthesis protein TonB